MTVNIIVAGALGRMGREICAIILADGHCRLAGALEYDGHPDIGRDIGEILGHGHEGVAVSSSIAATGVTDGVVIDFTGPDATMKMIRESTGTSLRFVIGTTGLSANQIEEVKKASTSRAVLLSPNMSLGVNFLFHLTRLAAEKLGHSGFDIEIIEAHHRFKKDSPSGTAKRLGEIAAHAIGLSYEQAVRHGREGIVGERTTKEIGMHAVRGGDIIGDHTVLFAAMGEHVELRHTATNRATFARGAVHAAKWIGAQEAGWYSMPDVLGI